MVNDAMLKVLLNNPYVWFTTKELAWAMRETCNLSASGKALCKRVMSFEDDDERLDGGRIERFELERKERYFHQCKFKYRWCPG